MDEIKIRNIHNGEAAFKKEFAIKKALMSSPQKIMIQLKNGDYFCVFPIFGSMNEMSLNSYWRYRDELTDDLFWRKSVKYTIIFRIGSILRDEPVYKIKDTEKIDQYIGQISDILQYRWSNIILDYSEGNNCKKLHMKGRFQKVAQKFSNFNNGITLELEFSAEEADIKIEEKSA
mgnify:CR=1 FL=1